MAGGQQLALGVPDLGRLVEKSVAQRLRVGLAQHMGVDPRAFVVAVMFAASASFATPIGYQTNTFVYNAGGYRFGDFMKVGIPLNILLWLVATAVIPLFWPLVPAP